MSVPLEDYALLSDLRTGALVSRDGSIDWLCLPRFDSPAVFSALLGEPEDGRWLLSVVDGEVVERRYLPLTFVLETTWRTPRGVARVTDFLPRSTAQGDLIRTVECIEGEVEVEHDLRLRFDYARATPWTREIAHDGDERALLSLAGPDAILVTGPTLQCPDTDLGGSGGHRAARLEGRFALASGDTLAWDLTWFPSHEDPPHPPDSDEALRATVAMWREWADQLDMGGPYREHIVQSLLVLRALTNLDTGGIVAAPTTSLPEEFGGTRNWDYRYTWLRDAAFTIEVVVAHGLTRGATLWRDWLLRAVAGDARDVRIMYGLSGERQLREEELDHLSGYEDSRPVRIGNGAADQYQADVVGEVMIALHELRTAGVDENEYTWGLQKSLLDYAESNVEREDHGIWEMRGDTHHFTHGRVMMWAAFDRGIRAVEECGLDGPVERWRGLRDRLAEEIEEHGFDSDLNSYTQTYDNDEVDASLLQLPHTGYLSFDDPRMLGTVARIERDLVTESGLVNRYRTSSGMDGVGGTEYPFVMCTFWLIEQYACSGRIDDAEELMETMLACAGDLGLFAEEYDPETGRLAGNFPQAFSHMGLIRAADAIDAARRGER
ncbi:glycoside hydrolase family 15 protein [Dietzia cinnamea]|uniref:glycoside hydrolase family 15 protein n=1 Tax=Dietzia cinnamea TaxID=321318 RepID=UPI00223A93E5|nr:glycoside hydrolase family 15 protein [Dietzia cinnamea]MCT2062362.1 glycoside hydrolase family 15 protein [Dietzia cinnamea]MCT2236860.1 glycoside hydrolase family 15 protein [Dietzia cinnamea]MCT2302122.1 glycoside hydrolase family 15 protein [Dietzia cinnamea]